MKNRIAGISSISVALWLLTLAAYAQVTEIPISGLAPFLYQNRTYMSVRDAADFVGAGIVWDEATKQAHVLRGQRELVFGPDRTIALDTGQPVAFTITPLLIDDRIYVPVQLLAEFFDFPVEWDAEARQPRILGPAGWGTVVVEPPPWGYGLPPWLEGKQLYPGPPRRGPGEERDRQPWRSKLRGKAKEQVDNRPKAYNRPYNNPDEVSGWIIYAPPVNRRADRDRRSRQPRRR